MIKVVTENVVDLWESIPTNWPKLKYENELVIDLSSKFRDYEEKSGVKINRILDCGCGTGNPSIGLAKEGFKVVAVDKDLKMVERFKRNCAEAGVEIPVDELDWRNLPSLLQGDEPLFDVVMCRGNGLIYVESWDRSEFSPDAARTRIQSALQTMVDVLKPGGILYVDTASELELKEAERHWAMLGKRETDGIIIVTYWFPKYDRHRHIRRLEVTRVEHSRETSKPICMKLYTFNGYLMAHEELNSMMQKAGCSKVEKKDIGGEYLYDSFWGYKPL